MEGTKAKKDARRRQGLDQRLAECTGEPWGRCIEQRSKFFKLHVLKFSHKCACLRFIRVWKKSLLNGLSMCTIIEERNVVDP